MDKTSRVSGSQVNWSTQGGIENRYEKYDRPGNWSELLMLCSPQPSCSYTAINLGPGLGERVITLQIVNILSAYWCC